MTTHERMRAFARAAVLYAALAALAIPAVAQSRCRDSFLAIQRQVETVKPEVIKATVAVIRRGGSGSGVIISPDGYVLTAAHVIAGRQKTCQVQLADGRHMSATIMGLNSDRDYGLIKIDEPSALPVAPLGDSSTLRRGEWVLATGHPLGPHPNRPPVLRIGRVMTLPRDPDSRDANAIVTDAPIISGDSGGPLFDLNGRVVGINSMILSGDRRMSSIHVPVNLAKPVMTVLKKGENPTEADYERAPFAKALEEANDDLRAGNADAGLKAAQHAAEIDPTSARAQIALARAFARNGKPAPALTAIEAAVDLGYNDPDYIKYESDFSILAERDGFKRVLTRLQSVNGIPGGTKRDMSLLTAAAKVEPNLDRGVVRLRVNGSDVALGTIMSADGDILTKASELPEGTITAVLPDGQKVSAERRKVSEEWDVALLKARATGLQPVAMSDANTVGRWIFSPDASGGVSAIGMVSVAEMPVSDKGIRTATSKAYLGVRLGEIRPEELKNMGLKTGVGVLVEPGFPADKAGLKSGDIIFEADGKPVNDPDDFMDYLVNKKPGDALSLKVAREEQRLNIVVGLAERPADLPKRGGLLAEVSGDISKMQGPFPQVMQHDTVLKPSEMGGPVLDLDGKCLGMNIARADRSATYAISARDLAALYAKLK